MLRVEMNEQKIAQLEYDFCCNDSIAEHIIRLLDHILFLEYIQEIPAHSRLSATEQKKIIKKERAEIAYKIDKGKVQLPD